LIFFSCLKFIFFFIISFPFLFLLYVFKSSMKSSSYRLLSSSQANNNSFQLLSLNSLSSCFSDDYKYFLSSHPHHKHTFTSSIAYKKPFIIIYLYVNTIPSSAIPWLSDFALHEEWITAKGKFSHSSSTRVMK